MSNEWEQAIGKLIRMTEAGELEWQVNDDVVSQHPELNFVGPPFSAEVNGKQIAIFEHRYRSVDDDGLPDWTHTVRIEFVSQQGDMLYVWPSPRNAYALLDLIRQTASGAKEFLSHFLGAT